MEWYGEKMLPRGLPELVYEITPPEVLRKLKVISLNRKEKEHSWYGTVERRNGYWVVIICPTVCLLHITGNECGTLSSICWKNFLWIMLHEIGHIMTWGEVSVMHLPRYEHDVRCHQVVEHFADEWRDQAMEKIASRDPRLGQPLGWIGGLPGLYLLRRAIGVDFGSYGLAFCRRIKDFRAYKCGGQYGVRDVMSMTGLHYDSPLIYRRIRQIIERLALSMGITRNYVDGACRKHLFFNHGEAVAVSAELEKTIPESWKKEEKEWRLKTYG